VRIRGLAFEVQMQELTPSSRSPIHSGRLRAVPRTIHSTPCCCSSIQRVDAWFAAAPSAEILADGKPVQRVRQQANGAAFGGSGSKTQGNPHSAAAAICTETEIPRCRDGLRRSLLVFNIPPSPIHDIQGHSTEMSDWLRDAATAPISCNAPNTNSRGAPNKNTPQGYENAGFIN
jgi:hypothetical protein